MTAPAVFPMVPRPRGQGLGDLVALLPFRIARGGITADLDGIVDSGATFSVLPYDIGLRFGLDWNAQPTQVLIGGALRLPAKLVLFDGTVGPFPTVQLMFAWVQVNTVPVLLGVTNFLVEFDVCFFRSRGEFHVQPRTP
jgi:hypothetical protein